MNNFGNASVCNADTESTKGWHPLSLPLLLKGAGAFPASSIFRRLK